MRNWLQNFVYRTRVGIDVFILSGLAALTLTLLTVGYQSIKSAAASPADSLRYE
jgi:putative ABC transport system permease protein